MPSPRQLVFDLPHRRAYGAEDFFVSASNAAAVELVDQWPDWPHWAAVVVGSSGAGKSHLANVWRHRSDATLVTANSLTERVVSDFEAHGALCVENLDRGISDATLLFHLLNLAREHKRSILLTTRTPPGELDIALPDLRSRLRALPKVELEAPDEGLLRAVLVKLFSDRQLTVEPLVINYLILRMERSMEAAASLVEEIDKLALSMQRRVTRSLAQDALTRVTGTMDQH